MAGTSVTIRSCTAFSNGLVKEGFDRRKVDSSCRCRARPALLDECRPEAGGRRCERPGDLRRGAVGPAIRETKSIPIIYAGVFDPAASVCRRNMTGISSKVPLTSLLKYAKKLTSFTKLAVYNELEPDSVKQVEELAALESNTASRR